MVFFRAGDDEARHRFSAIAVDHVIALPPINGNACDVGVENFGGGTDPVQPLKHLAAPSDEIRGLQCCILHRKKLSIFFYCCRDIFL